MRPPRESNHLAFVPRTGPVQPSPEQIAHGEGNGYCEGCGDPRPSSLPASVRFCGECEKKFAQIPLVEDSP
jgi:hypothetical protein